MGGRARGIRRDIALVVGVIAAATLVAAPGAGANNLDKRTMTDVAKQIAKKECRQVSGCKDWRVRGLHRLTRHKAIGKIEVLGVKRGQRFGCTRQMVIKLDHDSGKVFYGLSDRRCEDRGT